MAFADLTANLNLNIRNFSSGLNAASRQYNTFASRMINAMNTQTRATRTLVENFDDMGNRMHYLGISARDVSRIFAGIIVSQAFYKVAREIGEATAALWEFNKELDYARVTYSAIMGGTDVANGFLSTLQQFSVDTMFGFKELEGMSRKLLAYGIEYKNLMYVIEGLTNLGTLSGDAAALERLAVAIGQINAKGVLKAEEVRQLTNAYVPMYDILRTQLGLTNEDLKKNIGDLGITSVQAINAIVEYSKDAFGEMANAAMFTIKGLNERIVDSLKVMGSEMVEPVSTAYKIIAFEISTQLERIHGIYKQFGAGGVFEALVPNQKAQQLIREFIANFANGLYRIVGIVHSAAPFIMSFIHGLVQGINIVQAVLNALWSVIAAVFQALQIHTPVLNTLTGALYLAGLAFGVFVARALGAFALQGLVAVFTGIAAAVRLLALALVRNPIIAGIGLLVGLFAILSMRASGADNAIARLINTLSSFSLGGLTSGDILQPEMGPNPESADNAQDYWEQMTDGAEAAEDAIDDVDKAAKKANKSLLSFDEVFRLNEPSSAASAGNDIASALGDIEDIGLGGIGGSLIPEIPSFKEFANKFIGSLYNDLWEAVKTIASGTVTGALIGGLVGFAIGGLVTRTMSGALGGAKLGAKIGAAVGGGFAAFWSDAYKEMEGSLKKIVAGSITGTLIGGLIGLVIGAFTTRTVQGAITGATIGASIGALVGGGLGAFWSLMSEEMNNAIEGALVGGAAGAFAGGLLGLVIGAFVTRTISGALYGAKLGALVGGGVGALIGNFWSSMSSEMQTAISNVLSKLNVMGHGAMIGSLVGMVIGAFAGGLPGALRGAKIGAMAGALVAGAVEPVFADAGEGVKTSLEELFNDVTAMGYASLIGSLVGMVVGAIVGAFAGGMVLPGAKAGAMIGAALGSLGALVYNKLKEAGIVDSMVKWFTELGDKVSDVWNAIWDPTTWQSAWSHLKGWFDTLKDRMSTWFTERKTNVKTWWSNLWVVSAWNSGWSKVSSWFTSLRERMSSWFTDRKTSVKTWWGSLWVVSAWTSGWTKVSSWFTNLRERMSGWFTDRKTSVKTWWSSLWNYSNWTSGWTKVKTWFSNLKTEIKNWFTSIKSSISTWWDDLWDGKSAKATTTKDTFTLKSIFGGHATGGVFNREHIARFAEGNKAEAIIPLENNRAMQPFVDAVSNGLLESLAPSLMSSGGSSNQLPPMYVGTLIADERGIKELYKKFEVIQAQEYARKGLSY